MIKNAFERARRNERGAVEQELKYHLEKADYLRLIRACRDGIVRQDKLVTHYLDDPKLRLRKQRFGFRLRVIDGKRATLTLKFPAKLSNTALVGLKSRHEFEEEIPISTARALLAGELHFSNIDVAPVRLLFKVFSKQQLARIDFLGAMKTERTLAPLGNGFQMEIDKCQIYDQRFYELEVETIRPVEADKAVRELFRTLGIPYLPLIRSKLARFLEEWTKRSKA